MTTASLELLPPRELGGGQDEAGEHGDEGRVVGGGERAIQVEQTGGEVPHRRRVRSRNGVSSQARDAGASYWTIEQTFGTTIISAHLRRRRARGADRAVGSVGSRLWQAA